MSLPTALTERSYFEELSRRLMTALRPGEHLFLNLSAEQTQFIRINGARIRQIGTVSDGILSMSLVFETRESKVLRKATRQVSLSGISYHDRAESEAALRALQAEARELPPDPYATLPQNPGSSFAERKGKLLPVTEAPEELLGVGQGLDIAGIYASGPTIRAMSNSAGLFHWFSTESFSFDYSLYTPSQRALKTTIAGQEWSPEAYRKSLQDSRERLALLEQSPRRIERGSHRAYLAPAAVAEILMMFSWGGLSEASLRQGESPLRKIRSGEAAFSPLFSLREDFRDGLTPRFNSEGALAPMTLPLIDQGRLTNTLVSTRTAKEYGVAANGAEHSEMLRSPAMANGTLSEEDILRRLGTGFYLSNLHYLNWSDRQGGRITGMTRYACFWVEDGRIAAPIENMRFDDTIFSLLGGALEDVTEKTSYQPEISTYFLRQLSGANVPGLLLSEMIFTL